eukprot:Hpha_TRINITY_DN12858_c0_g1::TRINITY_DN12858_c0_g1_i1::g.24093::m.24093
MRQQAVAQARRTREAVSPPRPRSESPVPRLQAHLSRGPPRVVNQSHPREDVAVTIAGCCAALLARAVIQAEMAAKHREAEQMKLEIENRMKAEKGSKTRRRKEMRETLRMGA